MRDAVQLPTYQWRDGALTQGSMQVTKTIFFYYFFSSNTASSSTHLAKEAQDLQFLLDSASYIFNALPVKKNSSKETKGGRHPSPSKPTSLQPAGEHHFLHSLLEGHWRVSASLTGHPRWGRTLAGTYSSSESSTKGTEILCNTKRATLGTHGIPQRQIMQRRRVLLSQQITVTSLTKGKRASQVILATDQLHQQNWLHQGPP